MSNRELYQLVTIENGQKDADAIMKVFTDIHSGKIPCDVRLLNYYHELPVSFNAVITDVMQDRIDMNVHENQAVVMKHEKQTLIKCEYFPNGLGVHAYVALSNISRCRVILTRFSYAKINAERRGAVRVKITYPLEAQFSSAAGVIKGQLDDISVSGVSLKIPAKIAMDTNIEGQFSCALPEGMLTVPARFLKFIDTPDGDCVAILPLEVDSRSETLISQFIFAVQVDIIRDLKDQYI